MAYLGRAVDSGAISNIENLDNITFDGSSSYSLTKNSVAFVPASASNLLISIDGVVNATNFTVSGSTVDFGVAVSSSSVCNFIIHLGVGLVTSPSDGSVGTSQLASGAVNNSKIASDAAIATTKLGTGAVLQVVQVTKTDTFTSTNTSFTDITGLSASITPSSTSNKVLVNASIQVGGSATSRGALKLLRGSTDIYIGDAGGSRTRATIFTHPRGGAHVMSASIVFLDSPSSTSSTTYKIQADVESGQTLTINRSGDDVDNSGYYRTPSSITLMEIAG